MTRIRLALLTLAVVLWTSLALSAWHVRVAPGGAGYLSFDTTADFASYPATGLVQGAPAYVIAGGGSYWAWYPSSGAAPPANANWVTVSGGHWVQTSPPTAVAPFPMTGILSSGQSLSVGAFGTPVLSTTQPYANAQLHNTTPSSYVDGGGVWSVIPLIAPERAELFDGGPNSAAYPYNIDGETPDIAMANALSQMMGGASFLSTSTGQGGEGFTVISKGGSGNAYQSLLVEATVAAGKGIGYGVGVNLLTHGEADATDAQGFYAEDLQAYWGTLQADAQAITSQVRTVPLILSQQNAFPIIGGGANQSALDQLYAAAQFGYGMTQTSSSSSWAQGAMSTGTLTGNGSVTVTTPIGAQNLIVGLTAAWSTTGFSDINYGIDFVAGNLYVFELGTAVYTTGPAPLPGDTVSITLTGSTITYQHNGVTFYTSGTPASTPLAFKTSISAQYNSISNVMFSTGATVTPWLHASGVSTSVPGSVLLSGPKYYLPYSGSNRGHLTALGYQLLGEQYARTYYRYLSPVGWTNFAPTSTVRVGNVVTVTFSAPVLPLVWDTGHTAPHASGALAAWALGQGFEARTGGASGSLVTINSVAIQGGNQVVITCATQPDTIAYAHTPDLTTASSPTGGFPDGRCGLLRDSDSWAGPITGTTQYNWAPEFQVTGL